MTPERSRVFRFEDITVDVRRLEVRRKGEKIDLEPKAFRVLWHLLENRDRVVGKEELIAAIWAGAFVTDNALTRVIAQIRKQLGDQARSPRMIETVAAAGYRFIAEVVEEAPAAAVAAVTPPSTETGPAAVAVSAPPPPEIASAPVPPKATTQRWKLGLAAGALVAIAAVAWWLARPGTAASPHLTGLQQMTSSSAVDQNPALSPDGSLLAFSSDRTGHFEIYVRSLAPGAVERQITADGESNVLPAWSPDGQWIAYESQKRGGIAIVPATGGVARYLTETGSEPAWSPDSRTLVYSAGSVGKISLWLVGLDGAPPRVLTRSGTPEGDHKNPKWLADGRHIVFSAFFPVRGRPWIVDAATGELRSIRTSAASVLFPCLPGDARYLYYATPDLPGATGVLDPVGVWRARVNSRFEADKPELLIPGGGAAPLNLSMTADGSRIAVSLLRRKNGLWTLPLNRSGLPAGEAKPLIDAPSFDVREPAFSTDGSRLAYGTLTQGGDWMIFQAGADGSAPTPVSPPGQSSFGVSWSGSDALGYIADRKGQRSYWVAPLQGPPKLIDLHLDLGPYAIIVLAPGGSRLVEHSGNRAVGIKLVVVDMATGASRDLTPPGRTFAFPRWSPDGRWISAVERLEPKTDRRVAINVATLAIQNLAESYDDSKLFPSSWSADSEKVVFADLRGGAINLYSVSRSSGELRQLTHFDSASQAVLQPACSPRGDQIVFVRSIPDANIYVGDLRF